MRIGLGQIAVVWSVQRSVVLCVMKLHHGFDSEFPALDFPCRTAIF